MATPWNLDDLEIVGYADVLKETVLPSVVPPVFRLKTDARGPSCRLTPSMRVSYATPLKCFSPNWRN